MEIKLEPISTGEPFNGTVTTPDTALTQRDNLTAASKTLTAITTEEEQEAGVAYLRDVNAMLKITEDSRKKHKEPFWDFGKMIDAFAAKFSEPLEKEKNRLSGLVNHFQRKQLEEKQAAERKAREEAAAAQRQAEAAAAEIRKQAAAALAATTAKGKQAAANKLLAAQLAAEEAAMNTQAATVVLAAPTNTPKGLVTKVSYNFEITNPFEFIKHSYLSTTFLKWKAEDETLKVDRQAIIKALNHETGHAWLPPEGQDSITHPFGIRVFVSVATHVR